jgi:glycosyltransferase involved in cell wall biosynthesis
MAVNGDDSRSVSVVIATYNRAPLVPRTIENMLAQSLRPREIIVVDDGSTDETPRALARFGEPVHYVRQPNRGPAAARNAGLALATGRFIQFMDDDDLMSLNKIEAQVEAIGSSGADMAYGPWVQLTMESDSATQCGHILQSRPVPPRLPLYEWHLRGWALILQSCLFTRDVIARAGSLREDLFLTDDTEFLNRLLCANPKVVFSDACLVFHRMHSGNKLSEEGTTHMQKMICWAQALDYMLCNLNSSRRPIEGATRFRLAHFAWRIHREVARGDAVSPEAKQRLEQMARRYPRIAFSLYSAWLRVAGPVRTRLTGTNWTPPFRPRRLGAPELRLIREAGIRLGPGFVNPS